MKNRSCQQNHVVDFPLSVSLFHSLFGLFLAVFFYSCFAAFAMKKLFQHYFSALKKHNTKE